MTLNSIITQEGRAKVHIHLQSSKGGRRAKDAVRMASERADSKRFLFTLEESADSGPAEGINRGFGHVSARALTWLGAGDILFPGSLVTVEKAFRDFPDLEWITGQPVIVSELGSLLAPHGRFGNCRLSGGFSRRALSLGLHMTQTNHGVIQQEGTFWSESLWKKVGGLREQYRFAFDFDLWCRMAQHSSLVEFMAPLAGFRSTPNQVSSNLAGWDAERSNIRRDLRREAGIVGPRFFLDTVELMFVSSRSGDLEKRRKKYAVYLGRSRQREGGGTLASAQYMVRALQTAANWLPPLRALFRLKKIGHRITKNDE